MIYWVLETPEDRGLWLDHLRYRHLQPSRYPSPTTYSPLPMHVFLPCVIGYVTIPPCCFMTQLSWDLSGSQSRARMDAALPYGFVEHLLMSSIQFASSFLEWMINIGIQQLTYADDTLRNRSGLRRVAISDPETRLPHLYAQMRTIVSTTDSNQWHYQAQTGTFITSCATFLT